MNKLVLIASAFTAFIACCQPNYAQSLSVGNYKAVCGSSATTGVSISDTRNITANGVRQQVVHLEAEDESQAEAFVHTQGSSSASFSAVVTAPIQFSVQRGNANKLIVIAIYTAPGSMMPTFSRWTTTTTTLPVTGQSFLANSGTTYQIPVGDSGIPTGSTLMGLYFNQSGNPNNCNNVSSDINNVSVNGTILGIDATAGDICGLSCL